MWIAVHTSFSGQIFTHSLMEVRAVDFAQEHLFPPLPPGSLRNILCCEVILEFSGNGQSIIVPDLKITEE